MHALTYNSPVCCTAACRIAVVCASAAACQGSDTTVVPMPRSQHRHLNPLDIRLGRATWRVVLSEMLPNHKVYAPHAPALAYLGVGTTFEPTTTTPRS